ncbi:unnamed protein product, partial [Brachionus calyciflorus]
IGRIQVPVNDEPMTGSEEQVEIYIPQQILSLENTEDSMDEPRHSQGEPENIADVTVEIEQNMSFLDVDVRNLSNIIPIACVIERTNEPITSTNSNRERPRGSRRARQERLERGLRNVINHRANETKENRIQKRRLEIYAFRNQEIIAHEHEETQISRVAMQNQRKRERRTNETNDEQLNRLERTEINRKNRANETEEQRERRLPSKRPVDPQNNQGAPDQICPQCGEMRITQEHPTLIRLLGRDNQNPIDIDIRENFINNIRHSNSTFSMAAVLTNFDRGDMDNNFYDVQRRNARGRPMPFFIRFMQIVLQATIQLIHRMLLDFNPLVLFLLTNREILQRQNREKPLTLRCWMTGNVPLNKTIPLNQQGQRQLATAPVHGEIAAVFSYFDCLPPEGTILYAQARELGMPLIGILSQIDKRNPNCDPLCYQIIYVYGEAGYDERIQHNQAVLTRYSRVTMKELYKFRFNFRDLTIELMFSMGKLFQEYIVHCWVKIEKNNQNYLRRNQAYLRIHEYAGIMDHLNNPNADGVIGRAYNSWNSKYCKQCRGCIVNHYVFNPTTKEWTRRINDGSRLLLLHVRGATSYEQLRTVNDVVWPTFEAAANCCRFNVGQIVCNVAM